MIKDSVTSKVYFSEILKTDQRFLGCFNRITNILDQNNVPYFLLKGTKDIWCRDYMPIQLAKDKFIQFRYEPSYLEEDLELQTDPKSVNLINQINTVYSNLNIDGGNIVKWDNAVILTSRIFSENKGFNKVKLISEIEEILGCEVIIIPDIKTDLTGHSDGHLRFIGNRRVLVNSLDNEYEYWKKGFLKACKDYNLEFVEIPWFEYKEKGHPYSAIGGYVNYLEVGNVILFPIFEVKGNKDKEALDVISKIFPKKVIEPININEIGIHGGLMNCISWNVL